MTIQPDTVLRDTAISLLPMLVAGFFVDGWFGVLGTAATGLFVLANLFLLGRLIRRVTAYLAGEDPQGSLAVGFLVIKFPLALGIITLLAWVFDGLAVALGMGAMVIAIFVRGLVNLLQPPPAQAPVEPEPALDAPQRS